MHDYEYKYVQIRPTLGFVGNCDIHWRIKHSLSCFLFMDFHLTHTHTHRHRRASAYTPLHKYGWIVEYKFTRCWTTTTKILLIWIGITEAGMTSSKINLCKYQIEYYSFWKWWILIICYDSSWIDSANVEKQLIYCEFVIISLFLFMNHICLRSRWHVSIAYENASECRKKKTLKFEFD